MIASLILAFGLAWTPDPGVLHWNIYVSATSRGDCASPADCPDWSHAARVIEVDEPSLSFKKLGLKRSDSARYYVSITSVDANGESRFGHREIVVTGAAK